MNNKIFLMFLPVCLVLILNVASAQAIDNGSMKGTILTEGSEAFSNAKVCFYNVRSGPSPFEYWRNCKYKARTGDDGSFSEVLPTGEYYIMATKKTSAERPGPPIEVGDPTWPPWDGSQLRTWIVTEEGPTDIGIVSGAVPFKEEWLLKGETAIEGRILLEDGSPVKGVIVYASGDPKVKELVFVSDRRTGLDGKYIVRVDEDGTYYVAIRGADKPIEKVTVYSGETTKGIDIRVKENPGNWRNKRKKNKRQE